MSASGSCRSTWTITRILLRKTKSTVSVLSTWTTKVCVYLEFHFLSIARSSFNKSFKSSDQVFLFLFACVLIVEASNFRWSLWHIFRVHMSYFVWSTCPHLLPTGTSLRDYQANHRHLASHLHCTFDPPPCSAPRFVRNTHIFKPTSTIVHH
jgi:hypothetical protein